MYCKIYYIAFKLLFENNLYNKIQERLSEMGCKLESCRQIKMEIGDSYADAALAYFEAQRRKYEEMA